jgi:predicted phage-related endonuclease
MIRLTTQQAIQDLITSRANAAIEKIKEENAVAIMQMDAEARVEIATEHGVETDLDRYQELKNLIEILSAEKDAIISRLANTFKPAITGGYTRREDWAIVFNKLVTQRTNAKLAQTEAGKRICELKQTRDNAQISALVATSEKQLRSAIESINAVLNYSADPVEQNLLSQD